MTSDRQRRLATLQRQLCLESGPARPARQDCPAPCSAVSASAGSHFFAPPALPARSPTALELAEYDATGVVCLREVFPLDWIETMQAAVDVAMADPTEFAEEYTPTNAQSGRFFGDLDVWRKHSEFARFVHESAAAAIAAAVMRSSSATFFYDQLLVKEAGTAERTPWHQDRPYWAVQGTQVASVWLPLDSIPATSAVEYVSGSHLWGVQFEPYRFMDGSPYEGTGLPQLPDIETLRNEEAGSVDVHRDDTTQIVRWAMEPGDVMVFHADIVHGAPGYAGVGRRRALVTRWLGDDARFAEKLGEVAIPTFDCGLQHGDPFGKAAEHFPRII